VSSANILSAVYVPLITVAGLARLMLLCFILSHLYIYSALFSCNFQIMCLACYVLCPKKRGATLIAVVLSICLSVLLSQKMKLSSVVVTIDH